MHKVSGAHGLGAERFCKSRVSSWTLHARATKTVVMQTIQLSCGENVLSAEESGRDHVHMHAHADFVPDLWASTYLQFLEAWLRQHSLSPFNHECPRAIRVAQLFGLQGACTGTKRISTFTWAQCAVVSTELRVNSQFVSTRDDPSSMEALGKWELQSTHNCKTALQMQPLCAGFSDCCPLPCCQLHKRRHCSS